MTSPEIPFVRGRFLIPMVSHATFFAAIALSGNHGILVLVYMLLTFGLVGGFIWYESFRLTSFLKRRYPAECEKLIKQAGYGPNFILGLSSSLPCWGFDFAFLILGEGDAEHDRILKRIRQHKRWVWIELLSLPPVMFLVVISAVTISKH